MPRQVKITTRPSLGIKFHFLCFLRKETKQRSYLCRWICLMAVLVFLQYVYNTSNYCEKSWKRNLKAVYRNTSKDSAPFSVNKVYHYHHRIMSYDRFMAMNYRFTHLGVQELPNYQERTPICRLNKSILGPITVNKTRISLYWVRLKLPYVSSGGFYAPKHCRPRHRVAIFVPYRDRAKNLAIFLYYMHRLLQKQQLHYRIFVIEQHGHGKFNKGALYNVAYLESQRFGTWQCLVFHDVDLIPQDERILYSCPRNPTHMSTAVESMDYILLYPELFGGVTAMTPQQFLKVNGYSNYYWNWGAEDDDMFIRLQASRLPVLRYNSSIARYATLPHKKGTKNRKRFGRLSWAKNRFRNEGLKSLEYKLIGIFKKKLFTHILVDVNPFKFDEE